jgi:alpha-beta hydrolase superfamily lysophospholipase
MTIPLDSQARAAWRLWTLIAGLALAAAAVLSLPVVFGDLGGDRGAVNWFTIFVGALATGSLFWWLIIARPRRITVRRGVSAGVLAAVFAYPIVFFLMLVVLGEVPLELRASSLPSRLLYALLASLFAIVFGGWFTVLLGALVGGLLALGQRRLLPATQQAADEIASGQAGQAGDALRHRRWLAAGLALGLAVVLLVLGLGAWVWFAPLNTGGLEQAASPVASYADAVAAIEALQQAEAGQGVNPVCASKLLSHGDKADKVVVFYHGFTNCPEQFTQLGQQFYELGYNVFIPRIPHHGLGDRLTTDLARLSAEELARFGAVTVDIAQGLGDEVTVVGLSGGGNVAAWAAQERADVDTAVLIAPMLGILKLPPYTVKPVANAALTLPNFFIWWDAAAKENIAGPSYAYPRYPTEAVGGLMRLGAAVDRNAQERAPAVRRIVAVSNEADTSVNNAVLDLLVRQWRMQGSAVETYQFPAQLGLPHDVIDPNQAEQQIDAVYPILIDLITDGS